MTTQARSNTGYKGITYNINRGDRNYVAYNRIGKQRRFYINSKRTREQAFMKALAWVRS